VKSGDGEVLSWDSAGMCCRSRTMPDSDEMGETMEETKLQRE
jgi:hypothetical protein